MCVCMIYANSSAIGLVLTHTHARICFHFDINISTYPVEGTYTRTHTHSYTIFDISSPCRFCSVILSLRRSLEWARSRSRGENLTLMHVHKVKYMTYIFTVFCLVLSNLTETSVPSARNAVAALPHPTGCDAPASWSSIWLASRATRAAANCPPASSLRC